MPDIFISYSRKDSEQAAGLAEKLRAEGADVWMDTASLAAAETWSAEIVNGIKQCKTFIVLLSPDSVQSPNVTKEVSLASEKRKTIVPIILRACELNDAMEYALAGIQHVSFSDEEALTRSFAKLGFAGMKVSSLKKDDGTYRMHDDTIRIAVLPFEDQSPAHDNEWFSDGLTDELISTLGKLDTLFVVDSQSSRIYKHANLQSKEIASQLAVRYLVRGAVRKAAEKIRVQATLIDTSNGATLWDEKFSGTMEDIFEIQEKTAFDITQGLKLKLTKEEMADIEDRGTDNVEAYELYLRAQANIGDAKEDHARGIDWLKQAVALDPKFGRAYGLLAVRYANYFRSHGRKKETLELQRQATERAQALAPERPSTYNALANYYNINGEKEKAIEMGRKMIVAAPKQPWGYGVTGFMCTDAGKLTEAASLFEQALAINPNLLRERINLSVCYYQLADKEALKKSVNRSIPYFEQYLALHPDDQSVRVRLMIMLETIDRHDLADLEADRLLAMTGLFGNTYYQISSVYGRQKNTNKTLELLYKAAGKGYINFEELRNDKDWFGCMHALPNFNELMLELEELVARNNV